MPSAATRDQGKSRFGRVVLHDDPRADARAINGAWRAAGRPGCISTGPVTHLRLRLGPSGNLRGREKAAGRRGRPVFMIPAAALGRPKERPCLEVETGADRDRFTVWHA